MNHKQNLSIDRKYMSQNRRGLTLAGSGKIPNSRMGTYWRLVGNKGIHSIGFFVGIIFPHSLRTKGKVRSGMKP